MASSRRIPPARLDAKVTAELLTHARALLELELLKPRRSEPMVITVADLMAEPVPETTPAERLLELEIRDIGWNIYAAGGIELMQRYHHAVYALHRETDRRSGIWGNVSAAWDGIGGWLT